MKKKNKFDLTNIILILMVIVVIIMVVTSIPGKHYELVVTERVVSIKDTDVYQINAKISPETEKDKIIKYIVNNPLVAEVNDTGLVKPKNSGIVTVEIYTEKGLTNSIVINIQKTLFYPTSIKFTSNNIVLKKGEEYDLNYVIEPDNCNFLDVTFENSNSSVIELNNKRVKALNSGESVITIKTINDFEDKIKFTVINEVEKIVFEKEKYSLDITDKLSLKYTITPNDAQDKRVVFSSSDDTIVKVDQNGNIEALKKGEAKIYAKTVNGIQSETTIKVNENLFKIFPELNKVDSAVNGTINSGLKMEYNDKNIILYGSDYQSGNREKSTRAILKNINSYNFAPNLVNFVGDYNSSGVNDNSKHIKTLSGIIHEYSNLNKSLNVFTAGNHDKEGTDYLTKTGGYIGNNYALYMINLYDAPRVTSSCSSSYKNKYETIATNLENFLKKMKDKNIKSPILVSTHLPLHASSRSDNHCAGYIFEILNKYGKDLNIVFLFGHNHSGQYDNCLGGSINTYLKGSNLTTYDKDNKKITEKLTFTYMNAGYIGYSGNKVGSVSCNGTSVTSTNVTTFGYFEITNDKMIIKRYSSNSIYNVTSIDLK